MEAGEGDGADVKKCAPPRGTAQRYVTATLPRGTQHTLHVHEGDDAIAFFTHVTLMTCHWLWHRELVCCSLDTLAGRQPLASYRYEWCALQPARVPPQCSSILPNTPHCPALSCIELKCAF